MLQDFFSYEIKITDLPAFFSFFLSFEPSVPSGAHIPVMKVKQSQLGTGD